MLAFHPIVFKVDSRSRKLDLIKQLGLIVLTLTVLSPMFAYGEAGSGIVDVDGTEFTINYDAEGVVVNSIDADMDFISLLFDVEVSDGAGVLEIILDRSLLDSTFQGADDDFIIIADGDEPDFEETETTAESRTLRIELPDGTDEVEIIGTEFGTEAAPEPEPEAAPEPEPEITPEPEPETMPEPEAAPEPEPEVTPEPTPTPTPTPTPKPEATECGEGTVLKDGLCVLDERCGEGTVMKDGVCVLTSSSSGPSMSKGGTFDLVYGVMAGFLIAFVAAIILWLMSRGARRKN